MKKRAIILWTFFFLILLPACSPNATTSPINANSVNQSCTDSELTESASSSVAPSKERKDEQRREYLKSLGINSASVDLNDLEGVTRVYIYPLIGCGQIWYQSWNTPSEIPADYLIDICANNNFLDLPRDFEGVYLPGHEYAPADQVEAALQTYFDVDSSYLETSNRYQPDNHTYELMGGFGGGTWATAISAEQEDDKIIIEVGLLRAINEEEMEEMSGQAEKILKEQSKIITENGILTPCGTLIVEHQDKKPIQFCSYQIRDGFEWE